MMEAFMWVAFLSGLKTVVCVAAFFFLLVAFVALAMGDFALDWFSNAEDRLESGIELEQHG